MTFEERLSALGVDLSDLPLGYSLSAEKAKSISDIACRWFIDEDSPDGVALINIVSIPLFQYILHLIDIIDRMETRIDNLTGERDYLKDIVRNLAEECGYSTEYDGVPEYWRADDGCSD